MEKKFTRIITVKVEFDGDDAHVNMGITDENGSYDFSDPSLRWLGMARALSTCSVKCMENAAHCVQQDEIMYLKATSHEKDNV